jgi:hypothetical protein
VELQTRLARCASGRVRRLRLPRVAVHSRAICSATVRSWLVRATVSSQLPAAVVGIWPSRNWRSLRITRYSAPVCIGCCCWRACWSFWCCCHAC